MPITEAQLAQQVEHLLSLYNWRWTHFRPALTLRGWRTPLSGFPGFLDYLAVRPPRLLVFELKSEVGVASLDQVEWFTMLNECPGVEVFLWKPWDLERIAEVLR